MTSRRPPRAGGARPRGAEVAPAPLGAREIDELQALLASVPAPLEALDLSSLDGFLCGVLVQPEALAPSRWLPFVTDIEGRALPPSFDARRLHALVQRRDAELRRAIERRAWFDPWVFELDDDDDTAGEADSDMPDDTDAADEREPDEGDPRAADAVYPWAGGFVAALETFPDLLGLDDAALAAPLALVYRHVGADHLEDADALLAEIETIEPPADLATAVEELVRATLLLADVAGLPRRR